ncbi:MAG: aldo/keto reductase [Thiotrichales bacterium]
MNDDIRKPNPRRASRRGFLRALAGTGLLTAFGASMPSAASDEAETAYKVIPSSGEKLPVIGLGTSRVFEVGASTEARAGPREVMQALARVRNAVVDTSPMYGSAEDVVGDLGHALAVREQLFYATKVWTSGREAGIAQMRRSMERLRSDKIDLMQIHNLLDWRTHLATLRDWKAEGRIRYLGVTHYHEGAHDELASVLREFPFDFVQINYSLAEPESERTLLPLALDRGIAVLVNRPFARGELFGKFRQQPLPPWAEEIDCKTWGQFFLKFVISHPAVTCAIPGTSKARHMIDNLGAGRGRMPDERMRARMREYWRTA